MFKIESYVTPILLSYVDKYVKDFKPADAQVSLWGGGVVLHNLVLKTDVLQQEVALPFTLVSGRIHELLIQVPWTKIMSEPIIVSIDTIECILSLRPVATDDKPVSEPVSRKTQVVEAPPGYMQALVRRIVSNIAVRVHHLIVKYVQDDIVLSLNVKNMSIDSAGADWKPAFADIDQAHPLIRRIVVLDDLTLCMDNSDSDGKIRFYQDPLLYRCQLELRVLTKLVSANIRRASSINIQLRSSKLAWGVTSDQMQLLLRLLRERVPQGGTAPSPTAKAPKISTATSQLHGVTSNVAEPTRTESWSEWAWSWMPAWMDRESDIEEAPSPINPTPISLAAYLDDISLAIKLMELEGGTRKRSKNILDIQAGHAAFKCAMCMPTAFQFKMGIRTMVIKSFGKCACGYADINTAYDEPTIYFKSKVEDNASGHEWHWPLELNEIETAQVAEEIDKEPEIEPSEIQTDSSKRAVPQAIPQSARNPNLRESQFKSLLDFDPLPSNHSAKDDLDDFWIKMSPFLLFDYVHERSPANLYSSPYENPPKDFEYSDWEEECNLNIQVKPLDIRLCMGFVHRLMAISDVFQEVPRAETVLQMRVLTVEECDALLNNLPQRRINLDLVDLRVHIYPWDHSLTERPQKAPLVLSLSLPKGTIVVTAPLYPNRVCSAAGQMPEDTGPLWRGARVHVTAALNAIQASIAAPNEEHKKPCARLDLRVVTHILLHREYFVKKQSVIFSYALKIREANMSGSAPRLNAAIQVLTSMICRKLSLPLRQTTLVKDALSDEELVVLDLTIEELSLRGFFTRRTMTQLATIQSLRATMIQSLSTDEVKQAWLFSGPDIPTNTPYLRMAFQWCTQPFDTSLDYLGVWSEPSAVAIDPLFVSWLAYKPLLRSFSESAMQVPFPRTMSSTQYFLRRRTPPSSSGRGGSRTSYTEQVHVRGRSIDSSSEPSERKEKVTLPKLPTPPQPWWQGEGLLNLHERLKKVQITMDLGLILVYVTTSTASAVDCETLALAIEQHVANNQGVVVFSVGRWAMFTSNITKNLWHFINHDGPTYVPMKIEDSFHFEENSFPWKMALADVSCYALEAVAGQVSREKSKQTKKSQLKMTHVVSPRTVLELVTTSIILSVATKSVQHKIVIKKAEAPKSSYTTDMSKDEAKMRYFTTGADFKPTSLKEFLRGPAVRCKDTGTQSEARETTMPTSQGPVHKQTTGPLVSLGFHLHADTPPIIIRLEHDQVRLVAISLHCLMHVVSLLQKDLVVPPPQPASMTNLPGPTKTITRSVSEQDQVSLSESTKSEQRSELKTIFDVNQQEDNHIKTFFWFQWVISRATVVLSTDEVKLAFDMDDMITTIDLQEHYNQLKAKVASASIKQYERTESGQWTVGVLGGRVLEAKEPETKEENHFIAVTITQARISNLPTSWKAELHPKLLEQQAASDSMWEIYAVLAPLEIVIVPAILNNVMSVVNSISPRSYCPLPAESNNFSAIEMPFCYLSAGGLKLIFACDVPDDKLEDTFILYINKVSLNPHPDNPICRRSVAVESTIWQTMTHSLEGRQYEVFVKGINMRSAKFAELVSHEESAMEANKGVTSENPAVKWGQQVATPVLTQVLHPLDMSFILAPALFIGGSLACGPAVEMNLTSDCAIELNPDQINLALLIMQSLQRSIENRIKIRDNVYGEAVCPYTTILLPRRILEPSPVSSSAVLNEETLSQSVIEAEGINVAQTLDSGVDTATSRSTLKSSQNIDTPYKKSHSVVFMEQTFDASDYIEAFITMGVIEISLYAIDDASEILTVLKPAMSPEVPRQASESDQNPKAATSRSLTETIRRADIGMSQIRLSDTEAFVRKSKGNIPLLHAVFSQPNLYYWKRKSNKNLQLSLFNIWIGFGAGIIDGCWHSALLSTTRGVPDPITEIPPALFTLKYNSSAVGSGMISTSVNSRVNLNLDFERPMLLELSSDSLRRLVGINKLLKSRLTSGKREQTEDISVPFLFRFRRFMATNMIDAATIEMSQFGITSFDRTVGWDSASMQLVCNSRPDRLVARGLINALLISAGPYSEFRRPILLPLQLGIQIEALWEAWHRAEGGLAAKVPTIRFGCDLDRIVFDLRPEDVAEFISIFQTIQDITNEPKESRPTWEGSSDTVTQKLEDLDKVFGSNTNLESRTRLSVSSDGTETSHHFYKDDLRSGAFKIVSGGQLPMAYQVKLHKDIVSWRYPHPRAITRLIAFPLPDQDSERDAVLEFYDRILNQWEPLTFVKLPVNEPREIYLHAQPPEAIFSTTWRFRLISDSEVKPTYVFNMAKFQTTPDPLASDQEPEIDTNTPGDITAEQLSGILRVDSYFAPHLAPRILLCLRFTKLEINIHNSRPMTDSQISGLEGYYVTKPLMRSHRVLTITGSETAFHTEWNQAAGSLILLETQLSSDVLNCATGHLERLVNTFHVQAGLSIPGGMLEICRTRLYTSNVHVGLHVPRLHTILALVEDWKRELRKIAAPDEDKIYKKIKSNNELSAEVPTLLEGRVSLWIDNSCSVAMRVGQEGTDEIIPLGPGSRLAYRWRNPTEIRKIRFALATPQIDWHWSNSVPFSIGNYRVRLEEPHPDDKEICVAGDMVYVNVKQIGAHREMCLSGRVILANMLRLNILYKIRMHLPESNQWQTISTGELSAESTSHSVVCHSTSDMVLKIKFMNHDTGWSGDIPLKECPKENVPWLVKVPSEGDVPYISVWCRVLRARSDGRIVATIWPLYVLRSELTLDTDVLIATEMASMPMTSSSPDGGQPGPLIQTAPGRGYCTHLLAPGTTSARHSLSFQYRNIECPVTREAVSLHYGVTDISVFDKRVPINTVEEIISEITNWLDKSGRNAVSNWPYSIVTKHWPGSWQPALLQPRCEVTVRYQAVRAGGGCSLEVQLSPVLLLCNASPISLTLRAHDAGPVCKLEPGNAISPPSIILKKPFFMSIEIGRETFVSNQLEVYSKETGRYGSPPPGHVAIDYPITFAIQCNQKVALLNLHYEIKGELNVLGITSAYLLINNLNTDLLVSTLVVPSEANKDAYLRPKTFKLVKPTRPEGMEGTPLSRFWLRDRWRGGDVTELRAFLCIAIPKNTAPAHSPVPIRLASGPLRKSIALIDCNKNSIPVVVTQHKHEGRWIISIGKDPCPQFLVHNLTSTTVAIGQPEPDNNDEDQQQVMAVPDCPGASWCRSVEPGAVTHYSSPGYCLSQPPSFDTPLPVPFLTFAKLHDDGEPSWCPPVAVADGEQLVQLTRNITVKLRVRTYPHSTLVELRDTDQNDISASDIRRRLLEQFPLSSEFSAKIFTEDLEKLKRVGAEDQLGINSVFSATKQELEGIRQDCINSADKAMLDLKVSNTTNIIHSDTQLQRKPKTKKPEYFQNKLDVAPAVLQNKMKNETSEMASSSKTEPDTKGPPGPEITDNLKSEVSGQLKRLISEESAVATNDSATKGKFKYKEQSKTDTSATKVAVIDFTESVNLFEIAGCSNSVPTFRQEETDDAASAITIAHPGGSIASEMSNALYHKDNESEWEESIRIESERLRCTIAGIVVEMSSACDARPLFAMHIDRVAMLLSTYCKKIKTQMTVADMQIDNLQYENGQFDFAVIATTRAEPLQSDPPPALWNIFSETVTFSSRQDSARLIIKTCHDKWTVLNHKYSELTEIEIHGGPLALYIEDAYVSAVAELFKLIMSANTTNEESPLMAEARALQTPLRLRLLYIHPLDLTLTLHTAVRMYIALDQSPLHLSAFKLQNMFTSTERLAHALTVHYLSAAILGAGWVVGGLELLGAPGALAARVGGATGGVRGIASAAAAALLRSLSAWAGSLARNLDLLAGDEEHARRAAAARRRPPDSFVAGLLAGITNFAINILGAVGGLAHHPLVGVAVGETDSGAAALRRGLIGAFTKPLSATADLVAYAGHGLLKQTGWDPVPQPRSLSGPPEQTPAGWGRDCVRWTFRLADLVAIAGYEVFIDSICLQLILTHKFVMIAEPETERVVEMIDLRYCRLGPYEGSVIQLSVTQRRHSKAVEARGATDDEDYQVSAAAMARVAWYTGTGTEGSGVDESRILMLVPKPDQSHALHAALSAAIHHNTDTHFPLL